MPNGITPTDKPSQSKPMWEYIFGGLLWGLGFFGAGYMIKKATHGGGLFNDDEDEDGEDEEI